VLTVQEIINGTRIQYNISTNEPIFQEQPFVAYKDVNENFHVAECISTGVNSWSTSLLLDKEFITKAGVVLTDTMGNQSYRIFRYLPDDIYVDNTSSDYHEYYGNWTNNSSYAWGNDSRKAALNENDSAKTSWKFNITQEGINSIHVQFPKTVNHAGKLFFYIRSQTEVIDSIYIDGVPQQEDWVFLTAKNLVPGIYTVEMKANGNGQAGKIITADVIKISPIVREKSIQVTGESINLGEIPLNDSLNFYMEIKNNGFGSLTVNEITSRNNLLTSISILPKPIDPFSLFSFKIKINTDSTGIYLDTLIVKSDDPLDSIVYVPFSVKILPYFVIIDNEDTQNYFETSGTWNYSVAQAYGSTSRYASINQNPRGSAYFQKELSVAGEYDISFIVPTTVNAATRALYKIYTNNILTDSLFVNQNTGSGNWVHLKRMNISANTLVKVVISDPGGSQGDVLRTDALKIGIVDYTLSAEENNIVPLEFKLFQNYPNPFNPVTTILYQIPAGTNENKVTVAVYDAIGRRVALLVDEVQSPGVYRKTFDADKLASGIYFCRIHSGKFSSVIKMILIK
jgi:hypothetical protein